MADKVCTEVRRINVEADGLEEKTYSLAPQDLTNIYSQLCLCYPLFYNYQVEGDKLVEALKKLGIKYPLVYGRFVKEEKTRYAIKVTPSDKAITSIPFIEQNSPLTIAEAIIKHGRMTTETSEYPTYPEAPFYAYNIDTDKIVKGEEPLMVVKLTHLADGSCVSVTMSHSLADGTRHGILIKHLAQLYCDEDIGDIEHDRSYLWPDQLGKVFPALAEQIGNLPRTATPEPEFYPFISWGKEPSQSHALWIPKVVIDRLKKEIKATIGESETTLSSNDIVSALNWMLCAEWHAKKESISTVKDLDIDNSFFIFTIEALANGQDWLPKNYFGNAFVPFPVVYAGNPDSNEPESFIQKLAKLAMEIRKMVMAIRTTPGFFAQVYTGFYMMINGNQIPFPLPLDRMKGTASNNVALESKNADFGKGRPVYTDSLLLKFMADITMFVAAPNSDGMILCLNFNASRKDFIKNSVVAKELVPEMRDIYDIPVDEFAKILGLAK